MVGAGECLIARPLASPLLLTPLLLLLGSLQISYITFTGPLAAWGEVFGAMAFSQGTGEFDFLSESQMITESQLNTQVDFSFLEFNQTQQDAWGDTLPASQVRGTTLARS